ncbi:hypothetical protein RCL_jg17101.t1 [Rhizophagus clarus]|uniref:Integrase catalytic domain-containing protein n=1 Tax=Rhizophagus clarus TaxID=94130 RepID=A0A8H3LN55_9GLOM|nr:hypothetical protein RCL_jg17101.t1 [Rhizophagus clarus]
MHFQSDMQKNQKTGLSPMKLRLLDMDEVTKHESSQNIGHPAMTWPFSKLVTGKSGSGKINLLGNLILGDKDKYVQEGKRRKLKFDTPLNLQKELEARQKRLYQNFKGLWDTCKKAGYSFSFIDVKKWLDRQALYQIFRPSPKHIPYTSYSKITKPNTMHQWDLIEIPYDDNVDTNIRQNNDPIFYYSSSEVAEALKSIYNNPNNLFSWPQLAQYDKGREFMGSYSVEFLLLTGECCREYERFARRIVDNMNDTPIQLIGMSPNDATKLERIYSKTSVKYNHLIGEWENDSFERRRITDPIWSPSLHKIRRIVVRKNLPMPVLYYLDESGSQRPFVREQLMHIKEESMLPPRWVLEDN